MTKIIKRARVDYSNNYSWIGERAAEIEVDENGKTMYISAADTGEDALYYVSERSLFGDLTAEECAQIDKEGVIEEYETGPAEEYEAEEITMCKSRYYNCFLYLHKLIRREHEKAEIVEYTDGYGKDVDQMNLLSLKESDEIRDRDNVINRYIMDENDNIKYGVLHTSCDESNSDWIDAINAEAVIKEDDNNRKYLEVSWNSEVPETLSYEVNDKSIHDILTNDGDIDELMAIRETGHIYAGYEEAMNSGYKEAFAYLIRLISEKLEIRGEFEDMEDDDFELPEWYSVI